MKTSALAFLSALFLLPSCSYHSAGPPKLSDFSLAQLNPFHKRVPVRKVSQEELAAMRDYTIASHLASKMPDASLRPLDYTPPGLPKNFDLLHASLLPPKKGGGLAVIDAEGEVPDHSPIIPFELLDEEQAVSDPVTPSDLMEEAPLVPDAPTSVELPSVSSGEVESPVEESALVEPQDARAGLATSPKEPDPLSTPVE